MTAMIPEAAAAPENSAAQQATCNCEQAARDFDQAAADFAETGLEVIDLETCAPFMARQLHTRDTATEIEGMNRLARAFVADPDSVLQELVDVAVSLCGADSAGISIELAGSNAQKDPSGPINGPDNGANKDPDKDHAQGWRWVATSGEYLAFLNAILPRTPSACGICLERGRPQSLRVSERFFEIMGVVASTVTDGILLPWQVDGVRGTVWILAHGRTEAFDQSDLRLMQVLANFAAMGVRQQRQQKVLIHQASAAASAEMANFLAHQINNPLQSLSNLAYLAVEADTSGEGSALARQLMEHVERLSVLVKELLALPVPNKP